MIRSVMDPCIEAGLKWSINELDPKEMNDFVRNGLGRGDRDFVENGCVQVSWGDGRFRRPHRACRTHSRTRLFSSG